jgi:hypothetical protein
MSASLLQIHRLVQPSTAPLDFGIHTVVDTLLSYVMSLRRLPHGHPSADELETLRTSVERLQLELESATSAKGKLRALEESLAKQSTQVALLEETLKRTEQDNSALWDLLEKALGVAH